VSEAVPYDHEHEDDELDTAELARAAEEYASSEAAGVNPDPYDDEEGEP